MKVVYSSHLKKRLQERKFPSDYPSLIVKKPERKYFDSATNRYISVKKLRYAGKVRNIVVAYDIIDDTNELVTIYPISNSELENKIRSGRWKKYEKD